MTGMAGMAERQKEWQNGRMAEMVTYVLFMVHADDRPQPHHTQPLNPFLPGAKKKSANF
jgi:hypothetical protein